MAATGGDCKVSEGSTKGSGDRRDESHLGHTGVRGYDLPAVVKLLEIHGGVPYHLLLGTWERDRPPGEAVAADASKDAIEIEVICSDPSEHRRRVETRNADIDGLSWPTWQAVLERTYEDWTRPHLVLDTAKKSIEEVTEELFNRLRKDCKLKM